MRKYLHYVLIAILLTAIAHLWYGQFYGSHSPRLISRWASHSTAFHHTARGLVKNISSSQKELDLRIIVITFNRAESLIRCLESINQVEYYGDSIHLDIWIDRSKTDGTIHKPTFIAASRFIFKAGTVKVHRRDKHVGLYGQWLTSWVPEESTQEIALFVEDDLTVSKYIYKWLKHVHKKYDSVPYINGFSAQGRSMKHAGDPGRLHGPQKEVVFCYPVLGSWGFSPKAKNWLGFLKWYHQTSTNTSFVPAVPGLITTQWYIFENKRGRAQNMWTQWHIYYAYKHKELTLYVNLPKNQGLSINWEEPGLHYSGKRKVVNKDPLLQSWDDKYIDLPAVPVELDSHGKVVKPAQYDKGFNSSHTAVIGHSPAKSPV